MTRAHWERIPQLSTAWVNQVAPYGGDFLLRLSDGTVLNLVTPPSVPPRADTRGRQLGKAQGWPKDWTSSLGPGWVGTTSAFYLQQGAGWRVFAPKPELQGAVVTCVARWRQRLWVGSQSGLFEVDPATGTARRQLGLSDTWITALAVYQDQLYVGTFSGGLTCLGRGQLSSERIHCLLATSRGLWAGTPQGLLHVDRSRRHLPGETVWCLAERGDELWIGTDGGLLSASQARL
jgi:hypothetical protein